MKIVISRVAFGLVAMLGSIACSGGEKAEHSRSDLIAQLIANPNDQAARAAIRQLDRQAAEEAGLIYAIDTPDGRSVTFFEQEPGVLSVGQRAPSELGLLADGLDLNQLSFAQIFSALRGNEAVPEVLLAADARAKERLATLPSTKVEAAPSEESDLAPTAATPSLAHATSSGAHFRDAHGGCPTFGTNDICWLNRTGSWTQSKKCTIQERLFVGNYGAPPFDFKYVTRGGVTQTTVLSGEIHAFGGAAHGESTVSGTITQAPGTVSSWHFGGTFQSNCP